MVKQEDIGRALVAICKGGEAAINSGIDPLDQDMIMDDIYSLVGKLLGYLSEENKAKFNDWLCKKEKQVC